MSAEKDEGAVLAERIESLENSNRILFGIALVATLLALVAVGRSFGGGGEQAVAEKVVAEQFVLVDSSGNERGSWTVDISHANDEGSGPATGSDVALKFFGPDGSNVCALDANATSGGFLQFGSSEGTHFYLGAFPNELQLRSGPAESPAVSLTSALFSGGPFPQPTTMQFLELSDSSGKKVFNTADFYGFDPSAQNQ